MRTNTSVLIGLLCVGSGHKTARSGQTYQAAIVMSLTVSGCAGWWRDPAGFCHTKEVRGSARSVVCSTHALLMCAMMRMVAPGPRLVSPCIAGSVGLNMEGAGRWYI